MPSATHSPMNVLMHAIDSVPASAKPRVVAATARRSPSSKAQITLMRGALSLNLSRYNQDMSTLKFFLSTMVTNVGPGGLGLLMTPTPDLGLGKQITPLPDPKLEEMLRISYTTPTPRLGAETEGDHYAAAEPDAAVAAETEPPSTATKAQGETDPIAEIIATRNAAIAAAMEEAIAKATAQQVTHVWNRAAADAMAYINGFAAGDGAAEPDSATTGSQISPEQMAQINAALTNWAPPDAPVSAPATASDISPALQAQRDASLATVAGSNDPTEIAPTSTRSWSRLGIDLSTAGAPRARFMVKAGADAVAYGDDLGYVPEQLAEVALSTEAVFTHLARLGSRWLGPLAPDALVKLKDKLVACLAWTVADEAGPQYPWEKGVFSGVVTIECIPELLHSLPKADPDADATWNHPVWQWQELPGLRWTQQDLTQLNVFGVKPLGWVPLELIAAGGITGSGAFKPSVRQAWEEAWKLLR